jgi:hypothetical protein
MKASGKRAAFALVNCACLIVLTILMPVASVAAVGDDFTKTRFFQYFMDPAPPIKNAVFQKEMFSSAIPKAARIQNFRVSMEGGNYILTTFLGTNEDQPDTGGGSFKGFAWGLGNGDLILSDPTVNSNRTDIDAQETVTRMTADLLANLGIYELDRSSIAWDSNNLCFIGRDTSGDGLTISLELTNALPKRAFIRNTTKGYGKGYIEYDYTNTICNGDLPFQFTRYFGTPDNDKGKAFRVTLSSIKLTDNGLVLDPMKLLRPRFLAFYSNNVLYSYDKASGLAERIPTTEENRAFITSLRPVRHKIRSAQICIFSIMLLSLGVMIGFCFLNKQTRSN